MVIFRKKLRFRRDKGKQATLGVCTLMSSDTAAMEASLNNVPFSIFAKQKVFNIYISYRLELFFLVDFVFLNKTSGLVATSGGLSLFVGPRVLLR